MVSLSTTRRTNLTEGCGYGTIRYRVTKAKAPWSYLTKEKDVGVSI